MISVNHSFCFYSNMNNLINYYINEQKYETLDCIYEFMKIHFKEVNVFEETKQINNIKIKLLEAHVSENNKLMNLIQETLNSKDLSVNELHDVDWEGFLPDEIWLMIFSYLGKELRKIPLLNKKFNQLIKIPSVQAILVENYANSLNIENLINIPEPYRKKVKILDLSHRRDLKSVESTRIDALFKAYPQLQTLDLSKAKICQSVFKSIGLLHHLQSLKLSGHSIHNLDDIAKLQHLQNLDLSYSLLSDQEIASIEKLENLKTLLINCQALTSTGIESLANLNRLESLELAYWSCADDNKGLESISELKNLKTLIFRDCRITDEQLTFLGKLDNLKVLSLEHADITDEGLSLLVQLCPGLQVLDLSHCNITDKGFISIEKMENLQSIKIEGCDEISEDAIASIKKIKIIRE